MKELKNVIWNEGRREREGRKEGTLKEGRTEGRNSEGRKEL